jgi:DNA polymerase I-like protein with 3'-5' exonuclease and polymerase domains
MGLCLYYKGGKQAYIPIHHVNPDTGEHLAWQLTEEDCREQLQRIKDAGTFIVMHNGKFDYEVIKCTCGIEIEPNWDTIIGAHTINESERMGLKFQYIDKIDPTQAKYDIESLFIVPYKYVDPEIFALYAAHDAYMTDKLFEYQYDEMYSYVYEQATSTNGILELDPFVDIETQSGYVSIRDLNIGDVFVSADGKLLKINKKVDKFNKITIFYTLN